MASRNREPLPTDPAIAPVAGDVPTFETRANTDIFHILGDEHPRPPSPQPSLRTTRAPWYKAPSPFWLIPGMLLSAVLMGATIAPRTELYIKLACNELRPDYLLVPPPLLSFVDIGEPVPPTPDTPVYIPPPTSPRKPSILIPGPNKLCSTDPGVLTAVAKLSTGMTTSMGILSCLTTGAWSQLSDRVGRVRVLSLAALGVLFTDVILILVAFYADILPGGYRFLIVGSVIDGALGGWTTASATAHAYVSDTVSATARSRIFSFFIGSLFVGIAAGPTLGALLIQHTNDLLSIFYVGAALHATNFILCTIILPESLTEKERLAAKERYSASQAAHQGILSRLREMVIAFSRPLVVFMPKGRNWNLMLIGIAYGSAMLNMGSYAFKFQYAIATFGWGTTELGYWMSIIGVARSIHLVVLLPLFIKLLHIVYARIGGHTHTQLDLLVSRLSLAAEVIGYILCAVIVDPLTFTLATCWLALGGGFSPSVQSLALALCHEQNKDVAKPTNPEYNATTDEGRPSSPAAPVSETGRLFGALSVLQSLTSQIIGPSLFGAVFVSTIEVAPRAIFWTSAACIAISLAALAMVRLDIGTEQAREQGRDEESRLLG